MSLSGGLPPPKERGHLPRHDPGRAIVPDDRILGPGALGRCDSCAAAARRSSRRAGCSGMGLGVTRSDAREAQYQSALCSHARGRWPVRARLEGHGGEYARRMSGGYESWFASARDPGSPRALRIRHTRHRPRLGPESAALWCTVVDRSLGQRPAVVKQVFAAFPPGAAAGPAQFRGSAVMAGRSASWDLTITGGQPPLRPLRPAALYRGRCRAPSWRPVFLTVWSPARCTSTGTRSGCPDGGGLSAATGDPGTPIPGSGCTPPISAQPLTAGWSWCWPGSGSARRARRGQRSER